MIYEGLLKNGDIGLSYALSYTRDFSVEWVLELMYKQRFLNKIFIQPDVQYIVNSDFKRSNILVGLVKFVLEL